MAPFDPPFEDDISPHVDHWRDHGWVVMHDVIPADTAAIALAELQAATSAEAERQGSVRRADTPTDDGPRFRDRQFDGITLFPYPNSPTLNRLFVHPALVAFAATALGTSDLRLYQARIWSKNGDHTDYEQPMHRDRNHSMIPVVNGQPWGHVEYFVYLHDVDEGNGAPAVVPGSATGEPIWPLPAGRGDLGVPNADVDALYDRETRASARAGSVLAYRSDVWHRGRNLDPGRQRHILVAAYRSAAAEWIGFDALAPRAGSAHFREFVANATPEELQLFGVPRPGHPVWTPETLDGMAAMYPGLDLTPWRRTSTDGAD